MLIKFFKTKPNEPKPYMEDEAIYSAQAQAELAHATAALLAIVERGTCDKKLPKRIMALAEMLYAEAQTNHSVITTFLHQNERTK